SAALVRQEEIDDERGGPMELRELQTHLRRRGPGRLRVELSDGGLDQAERRVVIVDDEQAPGRRRDGATGRLRSGLGRNDRRRRRVPWEHRRERAAAPQRALHLNAPTVRLNEPPRQRQT